MAAVDRSRVLSLWTQHCSGMTPMQRNIPFASIRKMSAPEFVDLLWNELQVKGVVVGSNYRFGVPFHVSQCLVHGGSRLIVYNQHAALQDLTIEKQRSASISRLIIAPCLFSQGHMSICARCSQYIGIGLELEIYTLASASHSKDLTW